MPSRDRLIPPRFSPKGRCSPCPRRHYVGDELIVQPEIEGHQRLHMLRKHSRFRFLLRLDTSFLTPVLWR